MSLAELNPIPLFSPFEEYPLSLIWSISKLVFLNVFVI